MTVDDRPLLLLDLDETLIHCSTRPMDTGYTYKVPLTDKDGRIVTGKIYLRPGLHRFLETVARLYVVVVFTASSGFYGEKMVELIDPQGN